MVAVHSTVMPRKRYFPVEYGCCTMDTHSRIVEEGPRHPIYGVPMIRHFLHGTSRHHYGPSIIAYYSGVLTDVFEVLVSYIHYGEYTMGGGAFGGRWNHVGGIAEARQTYHMDVPRKPIEGSWTYHGAANEFSIPVSYSRESIGVTLKGRFFFLHDVFQRFVNEVGVSTRLDNASYVICDGGMMNGTEALRENP